MTINQENFETARSVFTNTVFVIPTFQRPYAWDKSQFLDLVQDIEYASTAIPPILPEHYLSPIHVIKITSPTQPEWDQYTDQNNPSIKAMTDANFLDADGLACNVYLVVDGQQRLATLFLLFYAQLGSNVNLFINLRTPIGVIQVPRMILNPTNDHLGLCQLLNIPNQAPNPPPSRSQKRLSSIFTLCNDAVKKFNQQQINVLNNGLKTLLIALDAHYGLRGFLTLNDRGKDLTYFEKLKSLLMEYDLGFGANSNPYNIHIIFGRGYVSLDVSYISLNNIEKSLFSDDELLRLLSIDVWIVAVTLNEGAGDLFARYRRGNPGYAQVHDNWLVKLDSFASQITTLTDRLNGKGIQAGLIYDQSLGRLVSDHYQVVCDSLGLGNLSSAVALKFSAMFDVEWHDKKYIVVFDNQPIIDLLKSEWRDLSGAIAETDDNIITQSLEYLFISRRNEIDAIPVQGTRQMSLLDLAECIELFVVQANSSRDFAATWSGAFNGNNPEITAFNMWVNFSTNWFARLKFFQKLLWENIGTQTKITRYILNEYESFLRTNIGNNALPHGESLDVEHFLPQGSIAAVAVWPYCGFKDQYEYFSSCNMLGNLLLLDSSLDRALQDQLYYIKRDSYITGVYVNTSAKILTQESLTFANQVGQHFPESSIKYLLRLRRLELLIFAVKRF